MNRIELYSKVNQLINRIGFDVRRFPTKDQRLLIKYLTDNNISHCFDVGANIGQYGKQLRSVGFKGNIYSFEPQKSAFELLSKNAKGDNKWQVFNTGLGKEDGKSIINISKNSVSSSMLDIDSRLTEALPETTYISTEEVQVNRLDTFIKEMKFEENFFLKIDTQGFESNILAGATNCFNNIYALQLELSCISLYKGEKLFDEMKGYVESKGFYLSSLESGLADLSTGRLMQVDAIFLREI